MIKNQTMFVVTWWMPNLNYDPCGRGDNDIFSQEFGTQTLAEDIVKTLDAKNPNRIRIEMLTHKTIYDILK